jgi:ferritin heavy chain
LISVNSFLQASYFAQDDVALKGFHDFFKKSSDEEREHGMKMMSYLNMRGGRLLMKSIEEPPAQANYSSPLLAMQFALFLEKKVNYYNLIPIVLHKI